MKSSTYYRLALLLPYLTLIPGYFLARNFLADVEALRQIDIYSLKGMGMSWMVLSGFWLIPYTMVAISLTIWSIEKRKDLIRSMFLRSPIILMIAMPTLFIIIFAFIPEASDLNLAGTLELVKYTGILCSAPFCLVFGYIFVLLGLFFYEILNTVGLIKDY